MTAQLYQCHLGSVFERLTCPAPSIQIQQQRQKIRIMSGLLLALVIAMIIIAPIWVLTSPRYNYAPLIAFGFFLLFCAAYGMSRTRFYMSGALMLIVSIPLLTVVTISTAPGPITERMLALQILVISAILAQSFLSRRIMLPVIALNVAIICSFFFVPDVPFPFTFSYLVCFLVILVLSAVSMALARNRYYALFYQSHDAIFMLDLQGRHLEANRRAAEILGYSVGEIQGLSMRDLSAEIDQSEKILEQVVKGETIPQYERIFRKKDGSYISVEIDAELIRDVDGKPSHIQSVVQDISARKQAEKALRDSQNKLTTVLENIPFRVFWKDQHSVYGGCNTLHAHGNGLASPDEIIGKTDYDFLPERAAQWEADDREVMTSGQPKMHVEELVTDSNGESHWLQSNKVAMRDSDGHVNGVLVTIEDVTERKQLEAALRASEERLRLITNNMQDLVILINAKEEIIYISPSIATVMGYDTTAIIGTTPADATHPDDRDRVLQAINSALALHHSYFTVEARLRHADGHYKDFEILGRVLYEGEADFSSAVFAARDITERKQMENLLRERQKLQTSLEKEQELSHLKTRMMERVAHEFRTPLSVIQTVSETLIHYYDRLTPEKRDEKAAVVRNQVRRISHMLDEMSFAIKGADTLAHLGHVPVDMGVMCSEIAAELTKSLKMSNKYHIETHGSLLASIDPKVMHSSLTHVMLNAARFSDPDDPVTIQIAQIDHSVELRVIDHGIGIPSDEVGRIFEPFYRASNINERGGLGIGLTIAHAAIEAHGGTIRVESELNKGASVIINLPA